MSINEQDLIGFVTFAREAEVDCPSTLDHEQVVARLEQIATVVDYREDGTAIGDGLGLAVAELQSLDKSLHLHDPTTDITRVVLLLTDGEQNAGELSPEAAARLAHHYGIDVPLTRDYRAVLERLDLVENQHGTSPSSRRAARGEVSEDRHEHRGRSHS